MTEPKRDVIVYDESFLTKIAQLKRDMHEFYMSISNEETPKYDSQGNRIIKKRPDGFDYLEEAYMRTKLDYYFPGWSWEQGTVQFVGGIEIVAVSGHLLILDEHLIAFGVIPPYRKFFSVGAARIQFKQGQPHTAENVVDVDKNIAAANSNALKRSINRLCRIGDDVYGKRVDEEGGGSLEEVIAVAEPSVAQKMFFKYLEEHHILHSKAMQTIGVKNWSEVTDWNEAFEKLRKEM